MELKDREKDAMKAAVEKIRVEDEHKETLKRDRAIQMQIDVEEANRMT